MDSTTMIQIVSGVLFALVLGILIQRPPHYGQVAGNRCAQVLGGALGFNALPDEAKLLRERGSTWTTLRSSGLFPASCSYRVGDSHPAPSHFRQVALVA